MTTTYRLQGDLNVADIYSHSLASAYHNEFRIIDPDLGEQKEPYVWSLIMRDASVAQAVLQRCAVVAANSWNLEPESSTPEDRKLAAIIQSAFRKIENFPQARNDLVKSIFRGRAYGWPIWRRMHCKLEGTERRFAWQIPKLVKDISKNRIAFMPRKLESGEGLPDAITTDKMLFSVRALEWRKLNKKANDNLIDVTYGTEEGRLGDGRGLVETLYFLWWARMRIIKEGMQAVERWCQGFLLAKVGDSKAGTTGKNPDAQFAAMRDMLNKHRARHIAVVGRDDEVSVVTGGSGDHQLAEFWVNYIDSKILAVAMGSVLPFGGSSDVGSLARSLTEQDVAEERTAFDRAVVDESITKSLVRQFVALNWRMIQALGLGEANLPRFKTSNMLREDPKEVAEVASGVLQHAPLKKEEFYSRVGWEQPTDNDDVIEPAAAPVGVPGIPSGVGPGGSFFFEQLSVDDVLRIVEAFNKKSLHQDQAVELLRAAGGVSQDRAEKLLGLSDSSVSGPDAPGIRGVRFIA